MGGVKSAATLEYFVTGPEQDSPLQLYKDSITEQLYHWQSRRGLFQFISQTCLFQVYRPSKILQPGPYLLIFFNLLLENVPINHSYIHVYLLCEILYNTSSPHQYILSQISKNVSHFYPLGSKTKKYLKILLCHKTQAQRIAYFWLLCYIQVVCSFRSVV